MKEQIIINMPLKNGEKTLERAIESVLIQTHVKREVVLLIANDNSTDSSSTILENYSKHSNIKVLNVDFGLSYLTRNHLLNYTRDHFPNCVLIGRLDCDDYLYNDLVLSTIEKEFDSSNFDALLAGNKQEKNNIILENANVANKELLDNNYLKSRLYNMSIGISKAELPSCNTFFKPTVSIKYPSKKSAEDHWLTTMLLLKKKDLNIKVAEDFIYCVYSLEGNVTEDNLTNNSYYKSREDLYQYFINQIKE
ncbi:glycosyltransferase family 2 protein [Winogradskyella rapida]|uniref:Glycosyltransferase family 2 protein n=1 Tax=Winogradskyella rapida TaxID=549701 RepID=A0ABW3KU87_9FLAO